ncbi:MAG: hypothetical protein QOJ32_1770 [Frankiaceae bacterium]|jgi:hypothetical protein|nr:hypothetical protein [Frankiaceae bacterium]MDQ1671839.1 hypothetical protein [Frankiaceae bacterium]
MRPPGGVYRNTLIRLPDLAVTSALLSDLTFENCQVHGPAILAVVDNVHFNRCGFDGTPEAVLWPIPPERTQLIGAIGLRNCMFVGCTLIGIGLAVPEAQLPDMRLGLGLPAD